MVSSLNQWCNFGQPLTPHSSPWSIFPLPITPTPKVHEVNHSHSALWENPSTADHSHSLWVSGCIGVNALKPPILGTTPLLFSHSNHSTLQFYIHFPLPLPLLKRVVQTEITPLPSFSVHQIKKSLHLTLIHSLGVSGCNTAFTQKSFLHRF